MARVFVCKKSRIPEGEFTNVIVGGRQVLVTNIRGSYFAASNICTHKGAGLHKGEIHDKELICPTHGARWDLKTGQLKWFHEALEPLRTYPVVIEEDVIFIEI